VNTYLQKNGRKKISSDSQGYEPICHAWGVSYENLLQDKNNNQSSKAYKQIPDNENLFIPDPKFNFNPCPENISDPNTKNISTCCRDWLIWLQDMTVTKDRFLNTKFINKRTPGYAQRMCDSWGTVESGYLDGNIRGEGRYDECVFEKRMPEYYEEVGFLDVEISGRYCSIFSPKEFGTEDGNRDYQFFKRQYGICIPSSCTEDDIPVMTQYDPISGNATTYSGKCVPISSEREISASAIICMTLVILLNVVVFTVTFLEMSECYIFPKSNFLSDFSAVKNTNALTTFMPREKREAHPSILNSLDGIKFFSLVSVVFGHTVLHAGLEYIDNFETLVQFGTTYFSKIINTVCVDSFLVVSGLLITMLTLKKLTQLREAKKRKMPESLFWSFFYIKRWLRLIPAMGFLICIQIGIYPFLGQGPVFEQHTKDHVEACEKYWWTNFLFINNFYPIKATQACVGWTWYLAVDWQCAIFAPILMVLFLKNRKVALFLIAVLLAVTISVTSYLDYTYDQYTTGITIPWFWLSPQQKRETGVTDRSSAYVADIYTKTWCRYGPYLVGMLGGFYFYQTRIVGDKTFLMPRKMVTKLRGHSKILGAISWIFLLCSIEAALVVTNPLYKGYLWTKTGAAIFMGFIRIIWAFIILFLIIFCENNQYTGNLGKLIHKFLGADIWLILNRLGYSAYLIQSLVVYFFYHTMMVQYHNDTLHLLWYCFGNLFIVILLAYFMFIVVEAPFANLVGRYMG